MVYQKVLIIGFGSLGQGLLPLLFRHFPYISPRDVKVVARDITEEHLPELQEFGVQYEQLAITKENLVDVLAPYGEGDLVINVSVNVSSHAILVQGRSNNFRYIDTCVEPWEGGYHTREVSLASNRYLRDQVLRLRDGGKHNSTSVIAHGANPGLISHFMKKGLVELYKHQNQPESVLGGAGFGDLANFLQVEAIQIAERDTQTTDIPLREDTFYNTWSPEGFLSEAHQPAEFGIGNHEWKGLGPRSRNTYLGSGNARYTMLLQRSIDTMVQSWVPSIGPQDAFAITHHENMSICAYLGGAAALFKPKAVTSYYAYRPSDATMASIENWRNGKITKYKVLRDEITHGFDELGCLFLHPGGAYWYGSTLTIEETRALVPYNNATSLQVNAAIIGALVWMEANPEHGIVEPEDVDYETVLNVSLPYLGNVRGVAGKWDHGNHGHQLADFLLKEKK